jgi:hypothetical protein
VRSSINAWEFQDQRRQGELDLASKHFEANGDDAIHEGGEHFLSYVAYWCANPECDVVFAENESEEHDLGGMDRRGEHQIYTLQWWARSCQEGLTRRGYDAWLGQKLGLEQELEREAEKVQLDEQG